MEGFQPNARTIDVEDVKDLGEYENYINNPYPVLFISGLVLLGLFLCACMPVITLQIIFFFFCLLEKKLRILMGSFLYNVIRGVLFFFFSFFRKKLNSRNVYIWQHFDPKKTKMCIYGSILIPKTDTNMYMLQHFDQKKTKCVYIAAF